MLQLFDEAHGNRIPDERVWVKGSRFYDALRPSVDPIGQDSPESVLALREIHLRAIREMFLNLDVFVFTFGLTEGWELCSDSTMFPVAPGTTAGIYESDKYRFRNLRHEEIRQDMVAFWQRLKLINPNARMLLTVSPVPLAATASTNHILVATAFSKSVLRSVCGELSEDFDDIYYFPSYEIISSHPSRGMFYDPDLRNVNLFGVEFVMDHFFSGQIATEFAMSPERIGDSDVDLICDESKLDLT